MDKPKAGSGTIDAGEICLVPVEVTDAFRQLGDNASQRSAATSASRPTRSGRSVVSSCLSQLRMSTPTPTLRSQGGGRLADRRMRPTVLCTTVRTRKSKAVRPEAFIFGEHEANSPGLPTLLRIYSYPLDAAELGLKTKDGAVARLPPLGGAHHTFKSVILYRFTLPEYAGILPSTDRLKVDGSPVKMDVVSRDFQKLESRMNRATTNLIQEGKKSLAELKSELRDFCSKPAISPTASGQYSTPPSSATSTSTSPTNSGAPVSPLSPLSISTSSTPFTSSASSPIQSDPTKPSFLPSRRLAPVRLALDLSKLQLTDVDEDPLQTVGPTQQTFAINSPPAESNGTSALSLVTA